MSDVIINLTMSLDGFIAYPDDTVSGLLDWYRGGEVSVVDFGGPRVSAHARERRFPPR